MFFSPLNPDFPYRNEAFSSTIDLITGEKGERLLPKRKLLIDS